MKIHSYRPLSPWQLKLHELSLTDRAIYIKLGIGLYLGFFLPVLFGFPNLSIPAGTSTMLTMAVGSSTFAARNYFYQRSLTNAFFMPVGSLLVWLTAPHLWLAVILIPLLTFPLVSLRPNLFRLTSLTVPLALVLYTGEHFDQIEERVVGVVLGMGLGFVIQQFVLPPDHGMKANRILNRANEAALEGLQRFIEHGHHDQEINAVVKKVNDLRTELEVAHNTFKLDLKHSWSKSHLSRNVDRLPLFSCYARIFETVVTLFEALQSLEHEYKSLGLAWHSQFIACLANLCEVQRALSKDVDMRGYDQKWPIPEISHESVIALMEPLPRDSLVATVFIGHCAEYGLSLAAAVKLHNSFSEAK